VAYKNAFKFGRAVDCFSLFSNVIQNLHGQPTVSFSDVPLCQINCVYIVVTLDFIFAPVPTVRPDFPAVCDTGCMQVLF